MKIHVDFDVHGTTLDEAITEAETRLGAFAPNLDEAGWHIVLHCSPSVSSLNGDSALWHVQVEADR